MPKTTGRSRYAGMVVRSNGCAFQIEMTYRAWRRGLRVREIPIIFMDRTVGDSRMTLR